MFKLDRPRIEIASKVFGWKKATMEDLAFKLETSVIELEAFSDEEFIQLMFFYASNYSEVS